METLIKEIIEKLYDLANGEYERGRSVTLGRAIEECENVETAAQSPQGKAAARACVKAIRGLA
jgi:hypothetical protein